MAASEPAAAPAEEAGLRRTSTAAIILILGRSGWQLLGAGIAFVFFSGLDQQTLALAVVGFALFAVVGGGLSWLSWSRFRYGIVDNHLIIREGVLIHRRRAIPVARVQGIDIKADLLSRILGLVEVTVQTAGGGATEPEASIVGIPLSEAERLRSALLHDRVPATVAESTASGAGSLPVIGDDPVNRMSDVRGVMAGPEVGYEAPSFQYQLSISRLFLAGATSSQVFVSFFVVLGAAGQVYSMAGGATDGVTSAMLALAIPVAVLATVSIIGIVLAASVSASVIADFGFTTRRVSDRIETERGLLERRMVGLSVRRVQSLRIQETPLRRLMGFSAIHVDTAGFGRSENNGRATAAVVPLARRSEIRPLLHGLLPELEVAPDVTSLPSRSVRRYLFVPTLVGLAISLAPAAVLQGAFIALPIVILPLTIIPAYLAWRGAGIGVDDSMLVLRSGMFGRAHIRIPRSRLQSLSISQNPFQKRANLATLIATTVSGSSGSTHRLRHMDADDARRLLEWLGRRPADCARPSSSDSGAGSVVDL